MKIQWPHKSANIALTPEDARFEAVDNFKAMMRADITNKPGIILHRTLGGDFNGLANTLTDYYCAGHNKKNMHLKRAELAHWFMRKPQELTPDQKTALSHIIDDLDMLHENGFAFETDAGPVVPTLEIMAPGSPVASQTHNDGPNRVLCAYNGPTTIGIADPLTPQDHKQIQAARDYQAKHRKFTLDPLRHKRAFAFAAGDLWRHAGIHRTNKDPFWHRGRFPKNGQSRLLLFANEPCAYLLDE